MLIERVLHDVRYAARSLRRNPGFAITAILVLALGIAANTAVFSVARGVLLQPLPYPDPDRLVQFVSRTERTQTGLAPLASVPKFNEWRHGVGPNVYSSIAAYYASGPGVTLTSGGRQLHLSAMYVSSQYFGVFGAPIALGRTFNASEDTPQGPRLAVISHAFRLREFGASRDPVGQLISLGHEPAQGGRLTAAGVLLGLGAAVTLSRLMSSVVFGIATWDPAVFGTVAALLSAVSVTAVYIPALAATRVDPMDALRR